MVQELMKAELGYKLNTTNTIYYIDTAHTLRQQFTNYIDTAHVHCSINVISGHGWRHFNL